MSTSKNGASRLAATALTTVGIALGIAASACGSSGEATAISTTTAPPVAALTTEATTAAPVTATSTLPSSTAATPTTEPPAFTKDAGIEYAAGRQLDVYAPAEPGRWPVVVVVHGLGQARSAFAPLAEAIAAEGAVVYNISTVFSVPPIDGIENISCAIRFARATAAEYGGDPGSLTLVGNSSGAAKGSIVAMDGDAYKGDCVIADGSALPNALVGYEGPFDYATYVYGTFDVPRLEEEDAAMWEAVNPYAHIGGNKELVVRLVHGRDDDAAWYDVRPEVSVAFLEALAAVGYDVELTYVEGATHGSLRPGTEAFEVTVRLVLEIAGI